MKDINRRIAALTRYEASLKIDFFRFYVLIVNARLVPPFDDLSLSPAWFLVILNADY